MKLIGEGKTKQIFLTLDPEVVLLKYKDTATAFNNEKKAQIQGKGEINNGISSIFFNYLTNQGVKNHFIRKISSEEQLVKKLKMIPLEVVIRTVCAGSLVQRFGFLEGTKLHHPIVEFYWKNDQLSDPLVNSDHIFVFKLADQLQVAEMKSMALKVNEILSGFLNEKNIVLVDFKLEFGEDSSGNLVLGDEISPDTCRFWDKDTGKKLDKDRFRHNLGQIEESYQEIHRRLGGEIYV